MNGTSSRIGPPDWPTSSKTRSEVSLSAGNQVSREENIGPEVSDDQLKTWLEEAFIKLNPKRPQELQKLEKHAMNESDPDSALQIAKSYWFYRCRHNQKEISSKRKAFFYPLSERIIRKIKTEKSDLTPADHQAISELYRARYYLYSCAPSLDDAANHATMAAKGGDSSPKSPSKKRVVYESSISWAGVDNEQLEILVKNAIVMLDPNRPEDLKKLERGAMDNRNPDSALQIAEIYLSDLKEYRQDNVSDEREAFFHLLSERIIREIKEKEGGPTVEDHGTISKLYLARDDLYNSTSSLVDAVYHATIAAEGGDIPSKEWVTYYVGGPKRLFLDFDVDWEDALRWFNKDLVSVPSLIELMKLF